MNRDQTFKCNIYKNRVRALNKQAHQTKVPIVDWQTDAMDQRLNSLYKSHRVRVITKTHDQLKSFDHDWKADAIQQLSLT